MGRYNPEKRAWRGKSYRKGGETVRFLREKQENSDMGTTTNGETFSDDDHADLAFMVYRRFGRDSAAATVAWNRLLQNNCSEAQFLKLVNASDYMIENPWKTVERLKKSISITDTNFRNLQNERDALRTKVQDLEALVEDGEELSKRLDNDECDTDDLINFVNRFKTKK
jgi:hypothetical protein